MLDFPEIVKNIYLYSKFFITKHTFFDMIHTPYQEMTTTVYSGNSKRLNSEQSLISEHFW